MSYFHSTVSISQNAYKIEVQWSILTLVLNIFSVVKVNNICPNELRLFKKWCAHWTPIPGVGGGGPGIPD